MQRVRIGITGLAVVFLVVLLAAAIVGFHSKQTNGGNSTTAETGNSQTPPAEPLADLGVTPGGTTGEGGATQDSKDKR